MGGTPVVYRFFSAWLSVTSSELSFVRIVALRTWPSSSCVRNVLKDVLGASFELAMRREAKNASTSTIRIGKAALLKNRLMRSTLPVGRARASGVYRGHFVVYAGDLEAEQCARAGYVTDNAATYGRLRNRSAWSSP